VDTEDEFIEAGGGDEVWEPVFSELSTSTRTTGRTPDAGRMNNIYCSKRNSNIGHTQSSNKHRNKRDRRNILLVNK
jgi:hypothetical protein